MSLTKATYSMIAGAPANVLDFGAKGDGITDDTAAIQAAVNASDTVYFPNPPGTFYKCTSPITIATNKTIYGANKSKTQIKFFGCSGFTAASTLLSAIFNITISNLLIQSDGVGTATQGITLDGTLNGFGNTKISDVFVIGFTGAGVVITSAYLVDLTNVESNSNGINGFFIQGPGTSTNFTNCYAKSNGAEGFRLIGEIAYSSFNACAAEANVGDGYFISNLSSSVSQGICFNACGSEVNLGHQFRFQQVYGLTLNSCWVNNNSLPSSGKNFLYIDGCRNVSLNGNYMAQPAPSGYYAFYLGNDGGALFPQNVMINGSVFSSYSGFAGFVNYYRDTNRSPTVSTGSSTQSNGDVITHNLGNTPLNVFVSTGSATVHAAAYNFTSTTFTVTIYDNAGNPINNQAIKWQASY